MLSATKILRDSFDDLGRYFGRIGDQSFAIILTATPVASAAALASSLRLALEGAAMKAAIGVAGTERHTEPAETLLAAAESAMTEG